ncbi:hypothetical protein ABZ807_22150 [Micromonospora sp. NPDC047548]|uniref:hypothetical protein n=1 Tax=Micromonospora sp. NPDC047548 TaxID=3155624 RepID=UPI003411ACBD
MAWVTSAVPGVVLLLALVLSPLDPASAVAGGRAGSVASGTTPTPSGGKTSLEIGVVIAPKPGDSPTPTPTPTRTSTPTPTPSGSSAPGGPLPRTGTALAGLLLAGGALVGVGVLLRLAARRRSVADQWLAGPGAPGG